MLNSSAALLDKIVGAVERASVLDRPAEIVASVLGRLIPTGPIKDIASGTPIGHPAHPVLIALPVGAWSAATFLDLTGDETDRAAARRLVGLGTVTAIPAALTGASDWLDTEGAERRVGFVHASLNYLALGLYGGSWLARRRGDHASGTKLALGGATVMATAAWLGGHLAYALGVGVDTTAFQQAPTDWTDAAAADAVGAAPLGVTVAEIPLLLLRHEGRIVALADRCTHRGGPLHEGTVADGCVTCPWHGSRFALADGAVRQGPATRPQPVYETRVVDGRVQVRRSADERALRAAPVGA